MTKKAFFTVSIPTLVLGLFVGSFVAAPLRGGLIAALQQILITPTAAAALIAAVVALTVGFLAFIGSWRQVNVAWSAAYAAKTSAEAAKTSADAAMMNANYVGTRALANVRLQWLNDLRDTLSKYHSILMEPKGPKHDDRDLSYLGTKLDLLLNQKKKYQQALWQVSDDILKLEDEKDYEAADKRLVEAARVVLDFHWRKIKAEMMGEAPLKEPPYVEPTKTP